MFRYNVTWTRHRPDPWQSETVLIEFDAEPFAKSRGGFYLTPSARSELFRLDPSPPVVEGGVNHYTVTLDPVKASR